MKSKLATPRSSDPAIQKSFNRIFDELNQIKNSMKSHSNADTESLGSGEKGDMRVSQNSNDTVSLEVRVKDGWYGSQLFDSNPSITSLTNNNGVSASDTISDTTGLANNADVSTNVPTTAEFESAVSSLASKINEIIVILNNMNVSGFKILDKREVN